MYRISFCNYFYNETNQVTKKKRPAHEQCGRWIPQFHNSTQSSQNAVEDV